MQISRETLTKALLTAAQARFYGRVRVDLVWKPTSGVHGAGQLTTTITRQATFNNNANNLADPPGAMPICKESNEVRADMIARAVARIVTHLQHIDAPCVRCAVIGNFTDGKLITFDVEDFPLLAQQIQPIKITGEQTNGTSSDQAQPSQSFYRRSSRRGIARVPAKKRRS